MSGSESAVFMCFGSVPGEAEAPANSRKAPASGGWMELSACSFGGSINFGMRSAATRETEADATPVKITKRTDASSPGLLRQAIFGAFDNPAVIVFLRTGPNKQQEEFLRLELTDCGIVGLSLESVAGDRNTEMYEIRYGMMQVKSFTWDASGNRNQMACMVKNQA
jgi:type VI protein secretion system component Hcp